MYPFRFHQSLRHKILLPLLVVGGALAGLTLWKLDEIQRQRLDQDILERSRLAANMVNYATESVVRQGELQRIVAAMGADRGVRDIVVLAEDPPKVIASTRGAWRGRALNDLEREIDLDLVRESLRDRTDRFRHEKNEETFVYVTPMIFAPTLAFSDRVGAVMVRFDTSTMVQKAKRTTRWLYSLLTVALAALSMLGYLLLQRHVLGPLSRIHGEVLGDELTAARRRDLSKQDEIGGLASLLVEERDRARSALLDLENQKHALDEHAIVAVTDRQGRIIYANDRFCSISGYDREDLLGQNHRMLKSGRHSREFYEDLWRTLVDGRVWRGEICNLTKSGRPYWVDTTLVPLLGPDNRPHSFIAIRTDVTKRKQTEMALEASERILRQSLDGQALHIALLNAEGLIVLTNRAWMVFADQNSCIAETVSAGVNYLEVCDKAASDGDDIARDFADGLRRLISGESQTFETEYPCNSPEEERWFLGNASRVIGDGPVRVVVSHQNITARKQMESDLREERERLAGILRGTNSGTWEWNVQSGKTVFNERWADIIGLTLDEISPTTIETWTRFCHPDDLIASSKLLERHFGGELDYYECEVRMRHKSGEWIWVLDRGRVVTWTEDGDPLMMMGTHQDINERKRAEAERKHLFATLFDKAPDGAFLVELTGRRLGKIVKVNETGASMLGYGRRELEDRPVDDLIPEQSLTAWERGEINLKTSQVQQYEGFRLHKNGSRIPVDVSVTIVELGGQSLVLQYLRDASDRKRTATLEKQLQHAHRRDTIGTLAGGIAHDFNNILSPVIGLTDMVIHDPDLPDHVRSDLEEVLKMAYRARDLVRRILSFSRVDQSVRGSVNIRELVSEVERLIKATVPKNIEVSTRVAEGIPDFAGDAGQLHQALTNLCTNAWQAMSKQESGTVTICADVVSRPPDCANGSIDPKVKRCVRLIVRDTGSGIDTDKLGKVFEPYFTTKSVGEGTGLGLSVVHGIVLNHGGCINVSSEPGQGTEFGIYLPLTKASPADLDPDEPTSAGKTSGGGSVRILLVDDESSVLKTTARLLKKLGHEVEAHDSADDALTVMLRGNNHGVDLIITDHMMPIMTGAALARRLRSCGCGQPILLVSGYADETVRRAVRDGTVDGFLEKPATPSSLEREMTRLLERNQPRERCS